MGERLLDTQEVVGSIPIPPTIINKALRGTDKASRGLLVYQYIFTFMKNTGGFKMNQIEIDEINKTIPYMDGKIYLKENDWTSKLWERMYDMGWKVVQSEEDPEIVIVKDEKGSIMFSASDRISMLRQLVNMLIVGF